MFQEEKRFAKEGSGTEALSGAEDRNMEKGAYR